MATRGAIRGAPQLVRCGDRRPTSWGAPLRRTLSKTSIAIEFIAKGANKQSTPGRFDSKTAQTAPQLHPGTLRRLYAPTAPAHSRATASPQQVRGERADRKPVAAIPEASAHAANDCPEPVTARFPWQPPATAGEGQPRPPPEAPSLLRPWPGHEYRVRAPRRGGCAGLLARKRRPRLPCFSQCAAPTATTRCATPGATRPPRRARLNRRLLTQGLARIQQRGRHQRQRSHAGLHHARDELPRADAHPGSAWVRSVACEPGGHCTRGIAPVHAAFATGSQPRSQTSPQRHDLGCTGDREPSWRAGAWRAGRCETNRGGAEGIGTQTRETRVSGTGCR